MHDLEDAGPSAPGNAFGGYCEGLDSLQTGHGRDLGCDVAMMVKIGRWY